MSKSCTRSISVIQVGVADDALSQTMSPTHACKHSQCKVSLSDGSRNGFACTNLPASAVSPMIGGRPPPLMYLASDAFWTVRAYWMFCCGDSLENVLLV